MKHLTPTSWFLSKRIYYDEEVLLSAVKATAQTVFQASNLQKIGRDVFVFLLWVLMQTIKEQYDYGQRLFALGDWCVGPCYPFFWLVINRPMSWILARQLRLNSVICFIIKFYLPYPLNTVLVFNWLICFLCLCCWPPQWCQNNHDPTQHKIPHGRTFAFSLAQKVPWSPNLEAGLKQPGAFLLLQVLGVLFRV